MHWHNFKSLVTDAWREGSTWAGAAGVFALAGLFSAGELTEWTARLGAAGGFVAAAALILKRARGTAGDE